jgi:erythromycin esterase-like protein
MSKSMSFSNGRAHNEALPPKARTQFRGLDIYSLGNSIAAVLAYLDRVDPKEAKAARLRYGCLTPWQDDPGGYGRAVLHLARSPYEDGVVAELRALLDSRLAYMRCDGESFFDVTQNALTDLDSSQLDQFEALLECADPNFFDWVLGGFAPPPEHDHDVVRLLRDFGARRHRERQQTGQLLT